jgi:simple sugar transport system ATP-binding protein
LGNEFLLEMNHICKGFNGNPILKDVNIRVRPGEIVALIGENGAGKSTLMNILFGMPVIHQTGGFNGEVLINGEPVSIMDPKQAMQYGIGMVHQEFMLIDGFNVAENIKLNRENLKKTAVGYVFGNRLNLLDRQAMHREAQGVLKSLNIDLDENTRVGSLSVGYKQFIEISRELDKKNIKLIVLDEPTAVLTETEAARFIECVRSVAKRGISFIFISHRLDEIKNLSDHVFILRDGETVGDYPIDELNIIQISKLMVGREVSMTTRDVEKDEKGCGDICLEAEHLSVNMVGEVTHDISFSVKKGEIFGIGGLAGHGKISIANGIMGLCQATGTVKIDGQVIDMSDTEKTLSREVAFVSEDRRGVGLALDESIELNIIISAMRLQNRFTKKICGINFFDQKAAASHVDHLIKEFNIRCTGRKQRVGRLSGGNQQKVCIARAFTQGSKILFISEPTRGIDIGAKKMILDSLLRLNKEEGGTIIVTSSELAELRSICNRIAIVTDGKIAGILKPTDDDYKFGLLMSGVHLESEENGGRNNDKVKASD